MGRKSKIVNGLKECNICKVIKPISEYTKNGKYYRGECKPCRSEEIRQLRAWTNSFKEVPCADCDKQYPAVLMDFDHRSGEKLGKVGSFLSREKVLQELEKCDIVCAMCHRIRTMNRLGLLTKEDFNVISKL